MPGRLGSDTASYRGNEVFLIAILKGLSNVIDLRFMMMSCLRGPFVGTGYF